MEPVLVIGLWFIGLLGLFLLFMKVWIETDRRRGGR